MRLSFRLAAVKTLRKKKKKNVEGGRRSIVKDDSKSDVTCKDIPEDILIEILVRLPGYSLMRFKCVSRFWYSLISSRYFTNLFFNFSSSTKPEHRVFMYALDRYMNRYIRCDYKLFSSSLSNLDATASFPTLNRDLTLPCIENDRLEFVNSLRGLMCFRKGREIQIINFTTRQVLRLPLVKSNMFLESDKYYMWNYFGYDPLNDEYKVLCTISSTKETNELRSETQVFVLGDGGSWRNTKSVTFSPPPHDSDEVGISINGVLYYGARSHQERSVLMSFDFNSEEFHLIEFPRENRIKWEEDTVDLMNYQDQVAVFDYYYSRLKTKCILDIWVLENAGKNKWSHKVLGLPCHQIRATLELDIDYLDIEGTSRSGVLRLCGGRKLNRNNKSAHAFYDLEKNRITRGVVFEPPYSSIRFLEKNLWEDVESIMYLEL